VTKYKAAKRRATWVSAALAALFYGLLLLLPAMGGYITAEQPITTYQR
jgi:hypothetical protein